MGLFTRNTMTLDQMAELVSYTALMILGFYYKQRCWPQDTFRTEVMLRWLERNGSKASFWKLSKLALVSDGLARMVSAQVPDLEAIVSDESVREEFKAELLIASRAALLQQNITA